MREKSKSRKEGSIRHKDVYNCFLFYRKLQVTIYGGWNYVKP